MNMKQVEAEIAMAYTAFNQLHYSQKDEIKALQAYISHLENYKLIIIAKGLISES